MFLCRNPFFFFDNGWLSVSFSYFSLHQSSGLASPVVGDLEPVVADLVKKALSNPATWPGGLPVTPVSSFGPSTRPLDADELEKQLVKAIAGSQAACTDIEDAPGMFEACEIRLEKYSPYPNNSCTSSEPVTMSQLKELSEAVLEHKPQSASDGAESGPVENDQDKERVRASRPDFKIILERYILPFQALRFRLLTAN